jgi:hypothetical protein
MQEQAAGNRRGYTRVEKVGLLLLATALLVALVGYLNQRGSLYMGE